MNKEETVKACPHGHTEVDVFRDRVAPSVWRARCLEETCNEVGPRRGTREEAIAAWNARPEEDRLRRLLARALREMDVVEYFKTRSVGSSYHRETWREEAARRNGFSDWAAVEAAAKEGQQ